MMLYAGTLADGKYIPHDGAASEATLFVALYNRLYSYCWLSASQLEFDIVLERIRTGAELPADHPLIVHRNMIDKVTAEVASEIGPLQPDHKGNGRHPPHNEVEH